MQLGLLTDIHNDAKQLRRAIEILLQSGVEQFVMIGDSFDPLADPEEISEVAELLMAHPTQGVWGNHDFAFCVDTPAPYTERYTPKLFQVTRLSVRGKGTTKEAKNAKGGAARVRGGEKGVRRAGRCSVTLYATLERFSGRPSLDMSSLCHIIVIVHSITQNSFLLAVLGG
ncbi:MAG: metallophosphoesterase family protein [Planctomycetes bacterium]|nr:metallophosphoesterase family protein [Planctomycetota bacterium]